MVCYARSLLLGPVGRHAGAHDEVRCNVRSLFRHHLKSRSERYESMYDVSKLTRCAPAANRANSYRALLHHSASS